MTYILQQVVKQSLGCELYYQNTVDDRAAYPFVTYNFVVPEQDTTGDWLGQGRQYETHLQVDCHAIRALDSMNMADNLFTALHENRYRAYFEQADIEPEEITNTSDRTVMAGSFYDYRFGFDCSFLVSNGGRAYKPEELDFTPSQDTEIRSVQVNDADGHSTVSAEEKEKE